MTRRIIILGSGMAGISLVRELRKLDKDADIVVLSRETGDFYSKPALSNALAAGKTAASLVLTPAARLAQDLQVRIVGNVQVTDVDTQAKEVCSTGGVFGYDSLVFAVGASQRVLPIAGDAVEEVHSVNSLADYARFRERLDGRRSVAIIGAGLIGCEFANDLRLADVEVEVSDIVEQPLGRLLPEAAAIRFRQLMEAAGIRFRLKTSLTRLDRADDRYALSFSDGSMRECDLVLSAIGLRPNVALAESAGLQVATGIVVDRMLRTSVPDVYAIGDCAEVDGLFLPYVLPITHGAKALARTLLGDPAEVRYPAMPVVVKTPSCPAVICLPTSPGGRWTITVDADGLRCLHQAGDGGEPDGFVLLGACVKERMQRLAGLPGLFDRPVAEVGA
jgi:rubredoxin-NAD+ reductase